MKRVVVAYLGDRSHTTGLRLVDYARRLPSVTFIAVADSPSRSAEALLAEGDTALENIHHLQLDLRLGKGAALRAGLGACDGDLVMFLSLDGTVTPDDISATFDLLDALPEVDGVVGNRFCLGARYDATPWRRMGSRLINWVGRAIFGISVADPQSPIKAFRRSALMRIFENLRLYSRGFDVELLFQAKCNGFELVQVPISWKCDGSISIASGVAAISGLLTLRILHSRIGSLPVVNLLGRRYCVPAKRSYSIMLFSWRCPTNPLAGGAEVYLHEQARSWIRAGHTVTWFAQSFNGSRAEEWIDGIRVVRMGRFPFVFLLGGFWYHLKSGRDFDFIIDCMNGIPFFTPLFSTKPKVCLVHHVHSHHFREELPPILSHLAIFLETKVVPFIYRRTPFLTVSPSTKSEMLDLRMTDIPVNVIHNGVPSDLVPGVSASRPTIAYIGRLKRYKQVRKLIDAYAAAKKIVPDARLVIAGTGDDELPLQQYVVASGVADVSFLGRVDEPTKKRLLQSAWVLGMPSSIEGWGIVVIEANACGTPAIAYDVPGLRDCIVHGDTGLLAKSDDEFVEHLVTLLTNHQLRDAMSASCANWSKQFSWESAASRTLELIRHAQPWRAIFHPKEDGSRSWELCYSQRRAGFERVSRNSDQQVVR